MSSIQPHYQSATHPLIRQVNAISWRARCLMLIHATAVCAAVMILIATILGTVDWAMRPQSPVSRWLISGTVLAALGVAVWRWLIPAIRFRISKVDVAKQIEAVLPGFGDRLSSSVAFLDHDASCASNRSDLEASVIDQTLDASKGVSFGRAINPWPTIVAMAVAFVAFGLLGGLSIWQPSPVAYAAARLAQPWRQLDWPRRNHLQFDPLPSVIHAGQSLEIVVRDGANDLPDDSHLQIRTSQGFESRRLRQSGKSGIARLENLQANVQVRAAGGDDDTMPWHQITVTQPPRITQHQWTLTPPAYTGSRQRTLEALRFEVLAGTSGRLQVQLSKPIRSAAIAELTNHDLPSPAIIPGNLSTDSMAVDFQGLTFDQPATLRIEWTDVEGIAGSSPEAWMMDVVQDALPTVDWIDPSKASMITPAGAYTWRWTAKDDFGIKQIGCQCRVLGEPEPTTHTLSQRDVLQTDAVATGETDFKPAALDLHDGQTVELIAWAIDTKDQRGLSDVIRIAIVSDSVIRQEVAETESAIVEKLRDATSEQRSARDQILAASSELKPSGDQADAARRVRVADEAQRQSIRSLQDSSGAIDLASRAVAMLSDNKLADLDSQRLQDMLESLIEIADQDSSKLADAIADVSESLGSEAASELKQQFDRIATQQGDVADRLEKLAGELSSRDAVRDLSRQIADLTADQQQLRRETEHAEMSNESPDASQRQALVTRQQEIAQRAGRIATEIQDIADEANADQPLVAERLHRAAGVLSDETVINQMRQSADDLQAGRLGQAKEKQSDIAQALQATQAALDGTDRSREAALADLIQDAAGKLDQVSDQQQEISRRLNEPDDSGQVIQDDWEKLAQETEEIRQRIDQLQNDSASAAMDAAAKAQAEGQRRLQQQDRQAAQDASRSAEDRLADARRELAELQEALESDKHRKQMWAVIEQIELILADQNALIDQIEISQADQLSQLAPNQKNIADRVRKLQPAVNNIAGFDFALSNIADDMSLVEANLARQDRSHSVIDLAHESAAQLQFVLDALLQQMRQQSTDDSADARRDGDEKRQDGEEGNENDQSIVASIRLLTGLQQWLLERTKQVEAIVPNNEQQRSDKQRLIQRLAAQQRGLHEQFRSMLTQKLEQGEPQ